MQRRMLVFMGRRRFAGGNGQRQEDAGDRRMHARSPDEAQQRGAEEQERPQARDAPPVHRQQCREDEARKPKEGQRQSMRVEERNDQDRPKVVEHR